MANSYYSKPVVLEVAKKITKELKFACSDKTNSILSSKETSTLLNFDWNLIVEEVKQITLIFSTCLESLFTLCDEVLKSISIGIVYAIVCQSHRETMNLFQ